MSQREPSITLWAPDEARLMSHGRANVRKDCRCSGARAVVYTASRYKAYKADLAARFRKSHAASDLGMFMRPVRLWLKTYYPTALRTMRFGDGTKAKHPAEGEARCDVDSMIKVTLDALTEAGVIIDDSIVLSVTSEKIYRPEDPGVLAWVSGMGKR